MWRSKERDLLGRLVGLAGFFQAFYNAFMVFRFQRQRRS